MGETIGCANASDVVARRCRYHWCHEASDNVPDQMHAYVYVDMYVVLLACKGMPIMGISSMLSR